MSLSKRLVNHLHSYCHEPIQIYLASVWLLYGIFILFWGHSVTTQEIPISLEFLGHSWHGIVLTAIGLTGIYGALSKNRQADFIFAAFSTFKSTVIFLELVIIFPVQPEWINFLVRMLASMLLLSRSIYNITHKY